MHPIDLIDAQLLKVAAPETPIQALAQWADPLKLGCQRFAIDGVRPIAALLAQAAHESCGFASASENLNYSAKRLAEVWPKRFALDPRAAIKLPNATARAIERKPEAIANFVYGNRMGNGPAESGDGWRFRGGGPFEITGRNNYQALADALGLGLDDAPAYVRTINGGAMSACWFFRMHGLEDLAITPGVADETKAINGGLIGFADRKRRFDAVVAAMIARGA